MKFHNFFQLFTKHRHQIILASFLFIIVIGLLAPSFRPALAFNWNIFNPLTWLSSGAKAIVNGLIMIIFIILSTIATAFLELSQIIFNWVTSPSFIGMSFTGPDNYIVTEGWKMMRNFANIFILLGLLFTGLATAFNVAGYNTKKGLLRLLVVALLINFTPVFCGVIIDGANFFTNAFLQKSLTLSQGWGEMLGDQLGSMKGGLLDNPGAVLAKAMLILVFDLVSAFVFFIFAALFAFRYVILWLLVIFSPLAFLAWAFPDIPSAKKIFDQWWQNFINWSIIGIPAAIVIYFSDNLVRIAKTGMLVGKSSSLEEFSPGFAGAMSTYSVPLIFLLVGFLFTLSTSAGGSSMIIGGVKSIGKRLGGYAGKGGKALGRKAMQGASKRTMGAVAGASQATEGKKFLQKIPLALKGGLTGAFKEESIEAGKQRAEQWSTGGGKFGYAKRGMGRAVLKAGLKSEQGSYDSDIKKAETFDLATNASRYQNAGKLNKLAILANENKQGRLSEFVKTAGISSEDSLGLHGSSIHLRDKDTQQAIERQFAGDMGEQFGATAQRLGQYTPEQQTNDRVEKGYTSYTDKIVDQTKTVEAIKQLGATIKANKPENTQRIMESVNKLWGGSQTEKASENLGRKFTQALRGSSKSADWYHKIDENTGRVRNADMASYRANAAAQKSGVGFTEVVSVKKLKQSLHKQQEIANQRGETIREQARGRGGFVIQEMSKPRRTKKPTQPKEPKIPFYEDYRKI